MRLQAVSSTTESGVNISISKFRGSGKNGDEILRHNEVELELMAETKQGACADYQGSEGHYVPVLWGNIVHYLRYCTLGVPYPGKYCK